MASTKTPSPKDVIKPISWLIGKWKSVSAKGKYPTITPFEYNEDLEFNFYGQPILQYTSKTYMEGKPKHFESGFLRIKPGTNQVSLLAAHNFGITSIEEGEVTNNSMKLKSTNIDRMSFASNSEVIELAKDYQLSDCGKKMELVVYMATDETPLSEHLRIKYEKENTC